MYYFCFQNFEKKFGFSLCEHCEWGTKTWSKNPSFVGHYIDFFWTRQAVKGLRFFLGGATFPLMSGICSRAKARVPNVALIKTPPSYYFFLKDQFFGQNLLQLIWAKLLFFQCEQYIFYHKGLICTFYYLWAKYS